MKGTLQLRFSPPLDLAISATPEELSEIAGALLGIRSRSEPLIIPAQEEGDPSPYAFFLEKLVIRLAPGPVDIQVTERVLTISGSEGSLECLASYFQIVRPGEHSHFEYYDGAAHVSPAAIPLVIASR